MTESDAEDLEKAALIQGMTSLKAMNLAEVKEANVEEVEVECTEDTPLLASAALLNTATRRKTKMD